MTCNRCNRESKMLWESVFDYNILICVDCKEKESKHPMYFEAIQALDKAEKNSDFKFTGIGSPEDL